MSTLDRSTRRWVWAALAVQLAGYLLDIAWHGLLHPGVEPATVPEMVRHLVTVHLPLYVGVTCVVAATGAQLARSSGGVVAPVALAGALLSAAGEGWHAYSHLQMDTHTAPIAGILSAVGFVVAAAATGLAGRHHASRATSHSH